MSEIKSDLKYAKTHEWVKLDGNIATIGISDYAQDQLGELVYAEAVEEGVELKPGDAIGSIESVKMASDVYSPVTGKIVESNESLMDEPEKINESPYDTWIVKVELADPSELDALLDAEGYKAFCESEA